MKSICPDKISPAPTRIVVAMPSRMMTLAPLTEQAGDQLAADHDPFMLVDLPAQPGKVSLLLIGGTDLPHIFQRLPASRPRPHSGALSPLLPGAR